MGAFNTDQIAVITYEVGLKTTAGANVTYVSHDIYANDTQAVYGSYTFTDTKGNAATNGKVLLNLTLNTESEVVEDNSQSKPLNFNSNTGEYTVTLYFYRAKRDMNGNILTDSSGNPVPEDQPLQKDGVTFTVQKQ
jgi:hypothetical protein